MKIQNILVAGFLMAGLISCEMKDELKGNGASSSEKGSVELAISVDAKKNPVTKGDATVSGSTVSPDNFPVEIKGVKDPEFSKNLGTYAEVQAAGPVELPVGTYMITAHSAGDIQPQMAEPYFVGEAPLTIINKVTSQVQVVCKMKNTKISLAYTSKFLASMKSWTITVDDGTGTLTFSNTDTNPAPIYWLVADQVSELNVNISGKKIDGTSVSESRGITKPAGQSSPYWGAQDELKITMDLSEELIVPGVSGITVTVDASFAESEESWEIPVEDENGGGEVTPTPPTPEGDAPTITSDFIPNGITYQLSADGSTMTDNPANAFVNIDAKAGLKSLCVKIIAGNELFNKMITPIGLAKGKDLLTLDAVENPSTDGILVDVISPLPQKGDKTYALDIAKFFTMMNQAGGGTTDPNGHQFEITVTDANGKTATATLKVIINQDKAA